VNTKQDYKGAYLDFNLNINLPPPCSTGYLPAQQQRTAAHMDTPDLPEGDLYCRVPQDSTLVGVRGARNTPCLNAPGKRAPTAAMCESDQSYVPLNDGANWKGDPNATLSGQAIPHLRPGQNPPDAAQPPQAPAPPPPWRWPSTTRQPAPTLAPTVGSTPNRISPDRPIRTRRGSRC
jgi:phospholipid/cholesterol/gamma-HCH transport system substrate-binding protein